MFARRLQATLLAMLLGLLACIGRLAWLQLWQESKYAAEAESTLISEELVPAPRGRIVALDGSGHEHVLAEDVPRFDVSVRVRDLRLREVILKDVKQVLEIRRKAAAPYFRTLREKDRLSAGEKADAPAPGEAEIARLADEYRAADEEYRRQREAQVRRLADRDPVVADLAAAAGAPPEVVARGLMNAMEHVAKNYEGQPPPVVTDVDRQAWDRLYLRQHCPLMAGGKEPIPGVILTVGVRRQYPKETTACHLLGYVAPLSEDKYVRLAENPEGISFGALFGKGVGFRQPDDFFFRASDGERIWLRPRGSQKIGRALPDERVGAYGVELTYNQELRGEHAYRLWRRSLGQEWSWRGGLTVKTPVVGTQLKPGKDLILTIDPNVQEAAEKALAESGRRGAAVFLDPSSGAVLAMASSPAFDPNVFASRRGEEVTRLMNDPARPLFCRAYQAAYPPGSTFKAALSVAAIEDGCITPATTFTCSQVLQVGNRTFECLGTHGTIEFYTGMRKSCNIYFYHVGLACGGERIGRWGREFGLGETSGLDLPGEFPGIMYSPAWKRRRFAGQRGMTSWTDGDTCNTSIGQGATLVSPLQSALVMAAIANGGRLVRPHLVSQPGADYLRRKLPAAPKTLAAVRKALAGVVNEGGTGRLCMMKNVTVAGKTGSAENPHGQTHAWFCGFAPAEDPTVAFSVLLENAGHGGAAAAPVARKVLEVLFGKDEPIAPSGEERD